MTDIDMKIDLGDKNYLQSLSIDQLQEAFLYALDVADLTIIKFLLTSSELKENIDIHMKEDYSFKYLVNHNYMNNKYIEFNEDRYSILMYLIFDYRINLNKRMMKCLTYHPEILKMFDVRGTYNKLNESLEDKPITKIKVRKL